MIDAMQILTNVLLCVILGVWHSWQRKQNMAARLRRCAIDAVHHVRTAYTRPIMQQRVQSLADSDLPRVTTQQRANVLRTTCQAAALTSEEKKMARQQAIDYIRHRMGGAVCGCAISDERLGRLVDQAHQEQPSLLGSLLTETACVVQLLSGGGDTAQLTPGTPDYSLWHQLPDVPITGDNQV